MDYVRYNQEMHTMSLAAARGFTLIELLVVIAIIAVLAGMVAVTLPKALEKAKITDMTNDFNQLRTAMVEYYTKYDSYPPAYGYLAMSKDATVPNEQKYFLTPYMDKIGMLGVQDLNDRFSISTGEDTDGDGRVSPLEYSRPFAKNAAGELAYTENGLYLDDLNERAPVDGERPYLYIPVNANQAQKVRKYFADNNIPLGNQWPAALDQQITFPPPRYDSYVLISVGPSANTGTAGILNPIPGTEGRPDMYNITGLRAYFLATRDFNANDVYDFHWEARTQQGEAKDPNNQFPGVGGENLNAPGPFIYYGGLTR